MSTRAIFATLAVALCLDFLLSLFFPQQAWFIAMLWLVTIYGQLKKSRARYFLATGIPFVYYLFQGVSSGAILVALVLADLAFVAMAYSNFSKFKIFSAALASVNLLMLSSLLMGTAQIDVVHYGAFLISHLLCGLLFVSIVPAYVRTKNKKQGIWA